MNNYTIEILLGYKDNMEKCSEQNELVLCQNSEKESKDIYAFVFREEFEDVRGQSIARGLEVKVYKKLS